MIEERKKKPVLSKISIIFGIQADFSVNSVLDLFCTSILGSLSSVLEQVVKMKVIGLCLFYISVKGLGNWLCLSRVMIC